MTISYEERTKLELRRAGIVELLHTLADELHDMPADDFATVLASLETPLVALSTAARAVGRTPGS